MKNQTNNPYGSGHFTVDLAGAANKSKFVGQKREIVHKNPEIEHLFAKEKTADRPLNHVVNTASYKVLGV